MLYPTTFKHNVLSKIRGRTVINSAELTVLLAIYAQNAKHSIFTLKNDICY
jgi:hypothetical protein